MIEVNTPVRIRWLRPNGREGVVVKLGKMRGFGPRLIDVARVKLSTGKTLLVPVTDLEPRT